MNIIPAIDLIDGQNVRLSQGDYAKKSQMKRTPEEALEFYAGFESVTRIHVVDLMGALKQEALESNLVRKLAELSSLPLEIGGGLRSLETIEQYHDMGVEYFILGTRAIVDVPWLTEAVKKFPGKIFVGVDAKEDDIYINGWTENSGIKTDDYLEEIETLDLAGVIYTDINKDGMGLGPNFENTARINNMTRHKVVASGGIRNKADFDKLESLGITEAIVGKSSHTEEFWEGIK
ncbi:HisA/HisF-related TIM barrel protein [Jeotgalicoccus sp. FSL K6-3177]|uniref:HisA/HisF-related TIM barrel protein n=1 Tax=Jeotgalicoccus sp. FSL K6-3177 TaxID=2921494 RepID=UPI0030FDA914